MAGRIEARLEELGITLPEAPVPQANYVPYRRSGNQVFIAGQVSATAETATRGKVGVDLSIEEGYAAARLCGLNILAQLHAAVGDDIDRAKAIKLGGFVNAPADFTGPPAIINGTSDLMVEVFGEEAGKHARFAVAVASLPGGAAVEVDAIFEIE
ncbi:MAG: RidA family protein [Rhodospirillaceae bacterium]|nr:RidA family protein [Rhodospirillaceae bacterium]